MRVIYCYLTANTEGSTVHVDSFKKAFTTLGEEIIDAGIITRPFTENKATWSIWKKIKAKFIWLKFNLEIMFRVRRLASQRKADLLLFRFMANHQLFIPIFFLSFFYPVVLEINDIMTIENPARAGWLIKLLDRLTLHRAKRCFVVSQLLKAVILRMLGLNERKIAVIENGVDVGLFSPATSGDATRSRYRLGGECVIGFVGSFKPWHGVYILLELAEQLKNFPVKFLLVGDGDCKKQCEEMAKEKGLGDRVKFTGFVPHGEIAKYIAAMDIVIAPFSQKFYEEKSGFYNSPLKIFEYMAMSKAIIAPPMGQISEVIVDGVSGRLLYSEDTEAVKEELIKMYNDTEYRLRMGESARERVTTMYTWNANAQKVRNLCYEALEQYV